MRHVAVGVVAALFFTAGSIARAHAQPPSDGGVTITKALIGGCTVVVALPKADKERTIWIEVDHDENAGSAKAKPDETTVPVKIAYGLAKGMRLRPRLADAEKPGPEVKPTAPSEPITETCGTAPAIESGGADERDGFEAITYVGAAVDTFAPSRLGNYSSSDAQTATRARAIAGIDFDYRIAGSSKKPQQLWIAGEVLYGARTADFCPKDQDPSKCLKADPANIQRIVVSATSMEAYVTPRFEFLAIQPNSRFASSLYATARFGAIGLSGAPQLFAAHHIGLGVRGTNGAFEGTGLEVGWGRSDIFVSDSENGKWNRIKIDGLLAFEVRTGVYGFVQLYADFDPRRSRSGGNADSVQTFFGLEFDLKQFFAEK